MRNAFAVGKFIGFALMFSVVFSVRGFAADDHAKFAGEWETKVVINSQPVEFFMTAGAGGDISVYLVTPNGRVLVKKATFTAQDGHYAENCTLGTAQQATYEFPAENALRFYDNILAVTWIKASSVSQPAGAGASAAPVAPSAPAEPAVHAPPPPPPPR